MKVWEGKQVVGFLLTWRLLRHQLQQTRQISTVNLISVTVKRAKPDTLCTSPGNFPEFRIERYWWQKPITPGSLTFLCTTCTTFMVSFLQSFDRPIAPFLNRYVLQMLDKWTWQNLKLFFISTFSYLKLIRICQAILVHSSTVTISIPFTTSKLMYFVLLLAN